MVLLNTEIQKTKAERGKQQIIQKRKKGEKSMFPFKKEKALVKKM
jgi:hypothetical protein